MKLNIYSHILIALFSQTISCNASVRTPIPSSMKHKSETKNLEKFEKEDKTELESFSKLESALIYYGNVELLNRKKYDKCNSNSLCLANFFKDYQLVVLHGILNTAENKSSFAIIKEAIKLNSNKTKFYAYINLGNLKPQSTLSLNQIYDVIDEWEKIGAYGIFIDEAGFDYGLGSNLEHRRRLNSVLEYTHSKGLFALINAWDPADIFEKLPSEPAYIVENDSYLLESYLFNSYSYSFTFEFYRNKMTKVLSYKDKFKIKLYGVNTSQTNEIFDFNKWQFMVYSAHLDNLDGLAWGAPNFGASNSLIHKILIPDNLKKLKIIDDVSINAKDQEMMQKIYQEGKNFILNLDYKYKSVSLELENK